MPLYITNLTDVDIHYRKLTSAGKVSDLAFNQLIDRAWDTAYAAPAKIRGLLDGQSGIVTGTLAPHPNPLNVEGYRYFDEADDDPGIRSGRPDRDFFAEVTPYQVHAKLGAYNHLGLGYLARPGLARRKCAGPILPRQLSRANRR